MKCSGKTFDELKQTVDAGLEANLWREGLYSAEVSKAMRYALFGNNKRLRPALTLLTAEALGRDPQKILKSACAVEVIHSASLILDDLPCMDNAETRRNRPTVHRQFGESIAILAAVGLHVHAVELLTANCLDLGVDKDVLSRLILELCRTIGRSGLIYGQEADLSSHPENASLERLQYIHEYKTASLFKFALEMSATLLNASPADVSTLAMFGRELGFMYQIMDDFLDVRLSSETAGKDTRKDASKTTYLSLLGPEKARAEWELCLRRAENALQKFGGDPEPLLNFARQLARLYSFA